jgi:hypothetical protein
LFTTRCNAKSAVVGDLIAAADAAATGAVATFRVALYLAGDRGDGSRSLASSPAAATASNAAAAPTAIPMIEEAIKRAIAQNEILGRVVPCGLTAARGCRAAALNAGTSARMRLAIVGMVGRGHDANNTTAGCPMLCTTRHYGVRIVDVKSIVPFE